MAKNRVRFLPSERVFFAGDDESILEAAMKSGVYINASCGGNGACGRCKIQVIEGKVETDDKRIPKEEFESGFRLACRTFARGDIVVSVPLESQIDRTVLVYRKEAPHILSADQARELSSGWEVDPVVAKKYLELPPPSLDDNVPDFERLTRELKKIAGIEEATAGLRVLRDLAKALRRGNWKVTVTVAKLPGKLEIISVEPGQRDAPHYSILIDVGTTTVCGQLLDLNGTVVAGSEDTAGDPFLLVEYSDYNGQISFGEDVISRIHYARRKEGIKRLQESVVSTINGIITELLALAGARSDCVSHLVCAGNTTMIHLLLGLNPEHIMLFPYTPTAMFMPVMSAQEVGIQLTRQARIYCLPSVASYVGGDIVAGVLGSGMFKSEEVTLYMDVGTNGEIVVGNRDWLMCASCSAGPAFEGGGIQFGVRAGKGAIEQVRIHPSTFEPMILTIGKTKPIGICGSGLIDLMAELITTGLIDRKGKFVHDRTTQRLRKGDSGYEYVLCWAGDTRTGKDIVITEVDLDNLIRTKAAIYAGCRVLLGSVGLTFSDVQKVIVAGGFGHFIDPGKAQIIGLLPEFSEEKFVFIGNGALLGSRLISLSKGFAGEAERIARIMTNIELSNSAHFMDEYVAAMFIPHTDGRAFPGVMEALGNVLNEE